MDMDDVKGRYSPYVRLVHDFQPGPRFVLPSRRINDHALLYVRRGSGVLTCRTRSQPVKPGDLMVIPPDLDHTFSLNDPIGVQLLNLHYDPCAREDSDRIGWVQDPQRPRPSGSPGPLKDHAIQVLHLDMPAAYESRFRCLHHTYPARDQAMLLDQSAAALGLLAWVLRIESSMAKPVPPPDADMEKARRFLGDRTGTVRLEDAARIAHMGRTAFAVAFQRQYGTTPMGYRRQVRIERAKADLVWGGMAVKTVAIQAGFANVHSFSRVFTRLVGQTPAAFARQKRH